MERLNKNNLRVPICYRSIIETIFEFVPRDQWRDIISNLVFRKTKDYYSTEICTEILKGKFGKKLVDIDQMLFILDDLDTLSFGFKPGDIVTHKEMKGHYIVQNYITFDEEYAKYNNIESAHDLAHARVVDGNLLFTIGISENGYLGDTDHGKDYENTIQLFKSTVHDYEKINYEPKDGEILYYIRECTIGNLKLIDKNPLQELFDNCTNIIIGDTSYKEKFDKYYRKV